MPSNNIGCRSAGLRTNVLVAVGAAAFVDLAMHLAAADGEVRVIFYLVSGIGSAPVPS